MSEKRSDDQKRDEVLKRMLATPPKPHDDKAQKGKVSRPPVPKQDASKNK